MKLWNIKDVKAFFKTVDSCSGKVTLIGEDIRLNLKSKLTQYFSFAEILGAEEIPELELEFENPEDAMKMIEFCASGM